MQQKEKNKMMTQSENKVDTPLTDYHFAGDGIYHPKTIRASSVGEAEEKWKQTRELVDPNKNSN